MDEIIQIIGLEKYELLRASYGGQVLFIPKSLPVNHPLINVIGLDSAVKLCKQSSGIAVYIRQPANSRDSRNLLIRKQRDTGALLSALARDYGISTRQVSTILSMN